jgi:hypothetical protein
LYDNGSFFHYRYKKEVRDPLLIKGGAVVVVAILVTSMFLLLLFAHWLIKRKRKG